jgi:hypothetical protein
MSRILGRRTTAGDRPVIEPSLPYRGELIAMGTMHGKERQLGPAFATVLGARVFAPANLDTDVFGTFSGEIARTLRPEAAARAKARLAMVAAATVCGLATEGSYAPLPEVGLPGHEELVVFIDDARGIEIIERHRTVDNLPAPQWVRSYGETRPWLDSLGFPAQALIVRPADVRSQAHIRKGVADVTTLKKAIGGAVFESPDGFAIIEPDLRAHTNPSRQRVLTRLAERLARRLATRCPSCQTPGYGRISVRIGLPCAGCRWPTDHITADVHGCGRCRRQETRPRLRTVANPKWCDRCNP